jgi:hypothetical protein
LWWHIACSHVTSYPLPNIKCDFSVRYREAHGGGMS